jgi:hypothetical protein
VTYTNRNFALAYLLLVVLPIVGLAGMLRSGRNLVAPNSVGGLWRIQIDSGKLAALQCGKFLAKAQDAGIVILQSGKNFTLNLANSSMSSTSGEIEGTTIKANILPSSGSATETGCDSGRVLSLIATADPKTKPGSLDGTLSVSDCPTCVPVEFHAVREDQAKAKGDH